jgi:hypothetical protein
MCESAAKWWAILRYGWQAAPCAMGLVEEQSAALPLFAALGARRSRALPPVVPGVQSCWQDSRRSW